MPTKLTSINPADGQLVAEYDQMSSSEVEQVLERAQKACTPWKQAGYAARAEVLRKAAQRLRDKRDFYARLMALEMGKPLAQGRAEVNKCAWVCEHYAEHGESYLAPETADTDAQKSYVTFQPLGVVLAIMPWNFPFWQVFRFAAPGLLAGNAGLLKHASNVMGCSLAIEEVFREAGAPPGVFSSLRLSSKKIGALISDPRILAVTLTGSTPAGRSVASAAGQNLKKTVLELGGSDAYVVLEDADLEPTVETCVNSRMINTGQSCIAAKRFIVVEKLRQEFERLFVEKMRSKVMGDPLRVDVNYGPLARTDLREELARQVSDSVRAGARLVLGGKVPEGEGAFYPATVLSGVKPGMAAFDEELFGPVAAICPAGDEEEAIRLANHSQFGLGAAVFTRDLERGEQIAAQRLEAGMCFVNEYVRSDPRLPFGGIKQSGYGRELSAFGIREFVNIKTVYVR